MLSILTGLSSRAAGALSVKEREIFLFLATENVVEIQFICGVSFFIMYDRNRVLYNVNI